MFHVNVFVFAAAASLGTPSPAPPPDPVVGGVDAEVCEFPAAAAGLRGDGSHACTVVVVSPRVVMLAAHCVEFGPLSSVVFGEDITNPQGSIQIEGCAAHPDFAVGEGDLIDYDLAYCTLVADAPAVQIVPPLMGCEADQLQPGASVTLAGYGHNDEQSATGAGRKRWIVNTIESVDEDRNDLYLLGADGASVCFGDSGGPAYMQLDDGSWRVVGITSESHPAVDGQPSVCGYGAVYDLVHLEMEWFETATGVDVTPCFDADGSWQPEEDCGGFPLSLTTPGLTWDGLCVDGEVSGLSDNCGDPFGGEEPGTSTGGSSSTGGDETTGAMTTGGETGADSSGSVGAGTAGETTSSSTTSTTGGATTSTTTTGLPATTGDAASTDTDAAADGDGDSGCGCSSSSPPGGPWGALMLVLGVFAVRRRR